MRRIYLRKVSPALQAKINDNLRRLGVLDEDPPAVGEQWTFERPPPEFSRPASITAQVWGRVNKTELSILIDSGSSISVCSNDFAQNHFRECRKIAYEGPSVTVANNDTVRPIGMVLMQTVIGPSATIVPFVIFPELLVDCLLGTDWLHNSGAITHWGKQVLLFEDSDIETSIRVIAAYSVAWLHLVKTLTIPAQTGMWAEVTAPLQHGMARLPRARVITDSDPWCASHTGVLCTCALQDLCNGGTKVFLVNSTTLPMQL
jgi:hypothetical protein